jgi:hypothetical protein
MRTFTLIFIVLMIGDMIVNYCIKYNNKLGWFLVMSIVIVLIGLILYRSEEN